MQWMWSLVEWPIYSLPGLNNIYIHPQHFLFSLWGLDFSRLLSKFFIRIFWILSQKEREEASRPPKKFVLSVPPIFGRPAGPASGQHCRFLPIWKYDCLREISVRQFYQIVTSIRQQDPNYYSETGTRVLSIWWATIQNTSRPCFWCIGKCP